MSGRKLDLASPDKKVGGSLGAEALLSRRPFLGADTVAALARHRHRGAPCARGKTRVIALIGNVLWLSAGSGA